jgi:heptosyltransferase II
MDRFLMPDVALKTGHAFMGKRRILITRTDRLGDVVLSTPVVRHLRKLYPEAYLAFMIRPETRDVVANDPCLDEVIIYDKRGLHKSFISSIRFAISLKRKKFDTAIALHPTNRMHIVFFVARIPERIGYNNKMGLLLTKAFPNFKHLGKKHEVDYNFELLERAGFDTKAADRRPYMVRSPENKALVDSVMKDLSLEGRIIAIHAGASCPSKRWPPERFAEVADALAAKYGAQIVLVGGAETDVFSGRVASAMTVKATDMTGKFLLGELAEFLSRCSLFISNDSGPVHVSAAVGTPCVVIFGRNDPGLSPERWGPIGDHNRMLHRNVGCQRCLAHNCLRGFACIKAVSAREVISRAEELLSVTLS